MRAIFCEFTVFFKTSEKTSVPIFFTRVRKYACSHCRKHSFSVPRTFVVGSFQERGYISRVHLGLNFRKDVCSDFFTQVWKDGCSYCRKHLFSSSRREGQDYHRRKHLPKTPFQFLAPRGTGLSPPKTLAENTAFQFTCGRI